MQLDLTMSNIIIIYGIFCVAIGIIITMLARVLDKLDAYLVKKHKENKNNDKH